MSDNDRTDRNAKAKPPSRAFSFLHMRLKPAFTFGAVLLAGTPLAVSALSAEQASPENTNNRQQSIQSSNRLEHAHTEQKAEVIINNGQPIPLPSSGRLHREYENKNSKTTIDVDTQSSSDAVTVNSNSVSTSSSSHVEVRSESSSTSSSSGGP